MVKKNQINCKQQASQLLHSTVKFYFQIFQGDWTWALLLMYWLLIMMNNMNKWINTYLWFRHCFNYFQRICQFIFIIICRVHENVPQTSVYRKLNWLKGICCFALKFVCIGSQPMTRHSRDTKARPPLEHTGLLWQWFWLRIPWGSC